MNKFPLRILILTILGLVIFTAIPSQAQIITVEGQIRQIQPPELSLWELNNFEEAPREDQMIIFNEGKNILLPFDRDVYGSNPEDWDNLDPSFLPLLPKGVQVNSYFVYLWNPVDSENRINAQATIIFNEPIIGLIGDRKLIIDTQDLFAPETQLDITQICCTLEGQKWENTKERDLVTIEGENNNILRIFMSNGGGIDPLRIVTFAS